MESLSPITFTFNGRNYGFDIGACLNKIVSAQVGKNFRTYNYYRFKATFKYSATDECGVKILEPMYVEVLTDDSEGHRLAKAIEKQSGPVFQDSWYDYRWAKDKSNTLYFKEFELIEKREGLKLNPHGVLYEMNKVMESKKFDVYHPFNDDMGPDAFVNVVRFCKGAKTVVPCSKHLDGLWYIITSRGDESDETISNAIKTIESDETFYDLHAVNEYVLPASSTPSVGVMMPLKV